MAPGTLGPYFIKGVSRSFPAPSPLPPRMDCRDMGALMNTSKCPLGPVWELLAARYAEETDAFGRSEVQHIEDTLTEVQAWLLREGRPPMSVHARAKTSQEIAEIRARPGGRCAKRDRRGRCRGVSHRFALYSSCPKHHCKRYSSKWH